MPVYDYTYKTWEGERRGPLFRWLAIPKFTYLELLGRKIFIWIFTVAWMPFMLWLTYIYLMVNLDFLDFLVRFEFPIHRLPQVGGHFFKALIDVQLPFCFFFTFLIGANLISRDLKHNALVLYVSKPIGRWEYLLGKFLAIFGLLMVLIWLQPMLLFVMQLAVRPEGSTKFVSDPWRLVGPITAYATIVSVTLALMILAASSLTRNGRYAGATFAIYIIGCNAVGLVVAGIFEAPAVKAISPLLAAWDLGLYLFGLKPWYQTMAPLWAVVGGILGQCGLCLGILYWRLNRASRYER